MNPYLYEIVVARAMSLGDVGGTHVAAFNLFMSGHSYNLADILLEIFDAEVMIYG